MTLEVPTAPGLAYATKHKGGGRASAGDGDPPLPGELALKLRWVRGIESDLDDLVVRGQSFTSHFGDALLTGTIVRKIVGCSELTITISDPFRRVLNKPIVAERHELELDGLHWILAKISGEGMGQPMTLTYEPRVVREMKLINGPIKGKREQMTRAEFAKKLTEMLPPGRQPRFISPLLHVKQPIQTEAEAKKKKAEVPSERAKGLNRAGLTVKGATPSAEQYELGEMALEICESHGAPSAVMTMLIMALIDETDMGAVQRGNVLAALEPYTTVRDAAEEISAFVSGEPTWTGVSAMGVYAANPSKPLYALVQEVQKSGTPDGSNYEAFEVEAAKWTAAYGGGVDSTNTAEQITKKYEFQVAKEESIWKAMVRLAGEVNWRCFESAGWIYFIDEIELLKQRTAIVLTPYAVGLENLTYDHDEGKVQDEITITARARSWSAPPGTMAEVEGWGPVDGTYLVSQIEAPLAYKNAPVQITLKRPHKPLKEPRPKTESKTTKSGSTTAELGGTGVNGSGGTGSASTIKLAEEAFTVTGTTVWNGVTIAKWIYPALLWAKENGANTEVTSGYRPGVDSHTASGLSEHQGDSYASSGEKGAIDFGGFVDVTGKEHRESFLDSLNEGYPGPMLIKATGFEDDGHCSATGS